MNLLPEVEIVHEFRQIIQGEKYSFDGTNLIELLAEFQMPRIGEDKNQEKFQKIQKFFQDFFHLPNAQLEIPRNEAQIIVNDNNSRLPLKSYGTGVHEMLILITATLSLENSIFCIEEPEIHLHPRLQREFINFLLKNTNNSYFITTHSPTLINSFENEDEINVFYVKKEENKTILQRLSNDVSSQIALYDLGYKASDLLQQNCIIWVEGPSDQHYISKWLKLIAPELLEGRDFVFFSYRILRKLNFHSEKFEKNMVNVFSINRNVIYVTDSDRKNRYQKIDPEKVEIVRFCEKEGGVGWITDGREIENYISGKLISRLLHDIKGIDVEVNFGKFDNFSDVIDSAIINNGGKPLQYDKNKFEVSQKISEDFSLEEIDSNLRKKIKEIAQKIKYWND